MVSVDEFETPLAGMRHLGVDAAELELTRDFTVAALDARERVVLASDDDAVAYRRHLESLGIRPSAFLTAYDLGAEEPTASIKKIVRAIELADIVGVPSIRIDSRMERENELTFGARVALFTRCLQSALEQTAGSAVALGIENHGVGGCNLAFHLNVYKAVGSDRLGTTLDTGNFYWAGYPLSEVYGIINILAPYVKHTHAKNINYPENMREIRREVGWEYKTYMCPIEEGDIDHGRVLAMLVAAGYDGDICLEDESLARFEPGAARIAVLKRDIAHLKACIASV